MAELPILPITTSALISDTTHMSAEQFGAYVRILLAMWDHGAELPYNDTHLARIAGVSAARWKAIKLVVLGPIRIVEGMLRQKRLSETWDQVQRLRLQRVTASNHRWNRSRQRNANAYPNGHAPGHASGYASEHPAAMRADMQPESERNPIKKENKITTTSLDAARARENPTKSIAPTDDLVSVIQKKGWVQS